MVTCAWAFPQVHMNTFLLQAAQCYKQLETGGTLDLEETLKWKSWKSVSLSSSWTPVHRCWGCFQRQRGLTQTWALLRPKSSVGKRLIPCWSWRNWGLCAMISAGSGFADIIPAEGYGLFVIFFVFLLLTCSSNLPWRFLHGGNSLLIIPILTPVETFPAVKQKQHPAFPELLCLYCLESIHEERTESD